MKGSQTQRQKETAQDIKLKTSELEKFNQYRKRFPAISMGLQVKIRTSSIENIEGPKLLTKRTINDGNQTHKNLGYTINLPQIGEDQFKMQMLSLRDTIKSRGSLNNKPTLRSSQTLKRKKSNKEVSEGYATQRLSSMGADEKKKQELEEFFYVNSNTEKIRSPFYVRKRSDVFLTSQYQNELFKIKDPLNDQQETKKIDNSTPQNFPKRIKQTNQKTGVNEYINIDTIQQTSSKISLSDNLQIIPGHEFVLDLPYATNSNLSGGISYIDMGQETIQREPTIFRQSSQKFFSNQRLQQEISYPNKTKQDSIITPNPNGGSQDNSQINQSLISMVQKKRNMSNFVIDHNFHSQREILPSTYLKQSSTNFIHINSLQNNFRNKLQQLKKHQNKMQEKVKDTQLHKKIAARQNKDYVYKDLILKSERIKKQGINIEVHEENKSHEQAQVSTESNSRVVEEIYDKIENAKGEMAYQSFQEMPLGIQKLSLNAEGQVSLLNHEKDMDNIEYVESFLKFKVDPHLLLNFFEENEIDIETSDRKVLKELLLEFLKIQSKDDKYEKKLQIQQMKQQQQFERLQKLELQRAKVENKRNIMNKNDEKFFEQKMNMNSKRQEDNFIQRQVIKDKKLQEREVKNELNQSRKYIINIEVSKESFPVKQSNKKSQVKTKQSDKETITDYIKREIVQKQILRNVFMKINRELNVNYLSETDEDWFESLQSSRSVDKIQEDIKKQVQQEQSKFSFKKQDIMRNQLPSKDFSNKDLQLPKLDKINSKNTLLSPNSGIERFNRNDSKSTTYGIGIDTYTKLNNKKSNKDINESNFRKSQDKKVGEIKIQENKDQLQIPKKKERSKSVRIVNKSFKKGKKKGNKKGKKKKRDQGIDAGINEDLDNYDNTLKPEYLDVTTEEDNEDDTEIQDKVVKQPIQQKDAIMLKENEQKIDKREIVSIKQQMERQKSPQTMSEISDDHKMNNKFSALGRILQSREGQEVNTIEQRKLSIQGGDIKQLTTIKQPSEVITDKLAIKQQESQSKISQLSLKKQTTSLEKTKSPVGNENGEKKVKTKDNETPINSDLINSDKVIEQKQEKKANQVDDTSSQALIQSLMAANQQLTKVGIDKNVHQTQNIRSDSMGQLRRKSTTSRQNSITNQLGDAIKRKITQRSSNLLSPLDHHLIKKQNSIEERISEVDSQKSDEVPKIELLESDIRNLKDKLFTLISENIFEASPEQRLSKIKLATMLETLTYEQIKQIGIKYNSKRDNFNWILEKLEDYQKQQEEGNKGQGFKLNKKTFQDLKKRLMPSKHRNSISFLSALQLGEPQKQDAQNGPGNSEKKDGYKPGYLDNNEEDKDQEASEEEEKDENETVNMNTCNDLLNKIFGEDLEFNQFKGKLKEYRMKFSQQTQFVESVKDIEEADRRDYATFDRLEAFKKQVENIKDVKVKTKKIATIQSSIKDIPANQGDSFVLGGGNNGGQFYINEDNDEGKQRISLDQLADEVMNMLLEVKRRNKFNAIMERKKNFQKRLTLDYLQIDHTTTEEDNEPVVSSLTKKREAEGESKNKKIIVTESSDADAKKEHLLKKYRLNLELKAQLQQMSDLERTERQYGILTKKGSSYLNPTLTNRYLERTYISNKLQPLNKEKISPKIKYKKFYEL